MTDTPQFFNTIATITDHSTTPPAFIAVDAAGLTVSTTNADQDLVTILAKTIIDYKTQTPAEPTAAAEPEEESPAEEPPAQEEPATTTPPRLDPADYAQPAPGNRNPTNPEIQVLATRSTNIDPGAFRTWWEARNPETPVPNPHTDPITVGQYLTETNQD